jgi:hypothetical protein
MEAEITALDTTSIEVEWLCDLLLDLIMDEKLILIILMNYDKQMSITKVKMIRII